MDGETFPELLIASAARHHAGTYKCVATNSYGTTESAVATVGVLEPPVIISQPPPQTGAGLHEPLVLSVSGAVMLECVRAVHASGGVCRRSCSPWPSLWSALAVDRDSHVAVALLLLLLLLVVCGYRPPLPHHRCC